MRLINNFLLISRHLHLCYYLMITISITLPKKLLNQFVIVHYLQLLLIMLHIVLLKNSIHALRIELKIIRNTIHPSLVHSVKTALYYVTNFKINQTTVLVQVNLDNVSNQQ